MGDAKRLLHNSLVEQDLVRSSLIQFNRCHIPPLCFRGPPLNSIFLRFCCQGLRKVLLVMCMNYKSRCSGMDCMGPCQSIISWFKIRGLQLIVSVLLLPSLSSIVRRLLSLTLHFCSGSPHHSIPHKVARYHSWRATHFLLGQVSLAERIFQSNLFRTEAGKDIFGSLWPELVPQVGRTLNGQCD